MNCIRASEYIMKYFDGSCNDIENAQLWHHLEHCEKCRRDFKQLREITNMLERTGTIEPPQGFESQVMKRINSLESSRRKAISIGLVFIYNFAAVLSIILLMLFGDYFKGIEIDFSIFYYGLTAVYGILAEICGFAYRMFRILYEVGNALVETYCYFLFLLFCMVLAIQKALYATAGQTRRGVR